MSQRDIHPVALCSLSEGKMVAVNIVLRPLELYSPKKHEKHGTRHVPFGSCSMIPRAASTVCGEESRVQRHSKFTTTYISVSGFFFSFFLAFLPTRQIQERSKAWRAREKGFVLISQTMDWHTLSFSRSRDVCATRLTLIIFCNTLPLGLLFIYKLHNVFCLSLDKTIDDFTLVRTVQLSLCMNIKSRE